MQTFNLELWFEFFYFVHQSVSIVKVSFKLSSKNQLFKMVKLEIPKKSTYFSSGKLSPLEMFKNIIERTNFITTFVGFDVFTPSYTPFNRRFILSFVNCLAFIAISLYDIFIFRTDLVRVCFILVTLGFGFQGISKISTFVFSRSKIVDLRDRCERFLTNFNTKETNEMFESWLMISCHIGVSQFALFFACACLFLIYPIIYYLICGEKILHAGNELPLIDWHTSSLGYAANFLYDISLIYLAFFTYVGTCFLNVLFVLMALGQFELLKMMINDLDEMIKSNDNGSKNDAIKKQIKLIVDMHNEVLR
jgi:hypothetical protein